jgi:PIN domain nuclease of toxin-antitoxin system
VSLLLDTHTFAWFFLGDVRLHQAVRTLITAPETDVFVSAISAYELALKFRLGLWPEAGPLADRFETLIQQAYFKPLDITAAHAIRAGLLPRVHRDPFDRIIAAQAQAENLHVVSRDQELRALGAYTAWG